MIAHIIPEQWLGVESDAFDQLFDNVTGRYCGAFERLTALKFAGSLIWPL
jgi:hypothetical protein